MNSEDQYKLKSLLNMVPICQGNTRSHFQIWHVDIFSAEERVANGQSANCNS